MRRLIWFVIIVLLLPCLASACRNPLAPTNCHKEGRFIGYMTAHFGPDSSVRTPIYADTSSSLTRMVCE